MSNRKNQLGKKMTNELIKRQTTSFQQNQKHQIILPQGIDFLRMELLNLKKEAFE